MADCSARMHYVCTHDQARALIARHDRFWIANCGCRESHGDCKQSRVDVCLWFRHDLSTNFTGVHEAEAAEVERLLSEAQSKRLVARPFRDGKGRSVTEGICFCCADCCEYFQNPSEQCDKGSLRELTDLDACTLCGVCIDECHFGARSLVDDNMLVDDDKCYGCGLCVEVCPEDCIEMVVAH